MGKVGRPTHTRPAALHAETPDLVTGHHTCAANSCHQAFSSSSAASLHYTLEHLGHTPPITRPVSCWRCATYIDTQRDNNNHITIPPCPHCGWLHPQAAQ